jgi:hypothetical protein
VPVTADPTVGLGLNLALGSTGADVGLRARLFSDNQEDKIAASLGLDYMFKSKSLRASVGAAYLMEGSYVEANAGYTFKSQEFNFGLGLGTVNTEPDDSLVLSGFGCPYCGGFHL